MLSAVSSAVSQPPCHEIFGTRQTALAYGGGEDDRRLALGAETDVSVLTETFVSTSETYGELRLGVIGSSLFAGWSTSSKAAVEAGGEM